MRSMRRLASISCLGLVAVALPACAINVDQSGYIEHEQKRFPAPTTVELHLTTFDGPIEVRAWDQPEVSVDVEKRGPDRETVAAIEVTATRTGNRIDVEAKHPGHGVFLSFGLFTSPRAKMVANVPRETNLVVRSDDGSVTAERVTGTVSLRTSDGAIRATGLSGKVTVQSGDGSVQLDDCGGQIDARTDDGSLRVTGVPALLHAKSGDGSIVIRVDHGAAMTGDWLVETEDGSISVDLPEGLDADVEADPGSDGHVRSSLALSNRSGGTRDDPTLRGRLGQGGHRLVLRTSDGTIRLQGS
jgi:Toastrack DUF4097